MPAVRGRQTAFVAALALVAVLSLCSLFDDRLYEAWYIHKIETGSPREAENYSAKLEEISCPGSIPALLGLLRRRKALILRGESEVSRAFFRSMNAAGSRGMAAAILALDEEERNKARRTMVRFCWGAGRYALLGCLRDAHPVVRLEAIGILYHNYQHQSEKRDLAPLLQLRQDPVKEVRRAAVLILARQFPRDVHVRRELRGALKDADSQIRRKAAAVLIDLRSYARLALPELIEALGDPDEEVRTLAAEALGQSGCEEALGPLTKAMGDPIISREAENSLWFLAGLCEPTSPAAAGAIPALLARLESSQVQDTFSVLSSLGKFGPAARAAVPFALNHLRAKGDLRECAASFLGEMGPSAAPAVPDLIEALEDSSARVRKEAARALGAIGKEASSAVPALWELFRKLNQEIDVRSEAAWALGSIGSLTSVARGALIETVLKERSDIAVPAAEALGAAADTEEALREALAVLDGENSSVAVRSAVICGLCRGKTVLHAALPSLIRALNGPGDDDGRLWLTAADALGELGSEAAEAIPALEGALSRDKRPRPAFFRALWKIDRKYVPLAVRAVKSLPQESALGLLEEIGPEAAEAVPAIISFLVSAKRDLRFSPYGSPELRALAAIGGPAVPALVDGLAKEDVILRVLAAETLGKIGADAETAVPALEKALSDEDDEVRREAAKALRKIRGAAAPAGPAVEDRP